MLITTASGVAANELTASGLDVRGNWNHVKTLYKGNKGTVLPRFLHFPRLWFLD
ncbi:MAG: hypothetical protein ACYDEF_06885 [Methanosarcina sp.]